MRKIWVLWDYLHTYLSSQYADCQYMLNRIDIIILKDHSIMKILHCILKYYKHRYFFLNDVEKLKPNFFAFSYIFHFLDGSRSLFRNNYFDVIVLRKPQYLYPSYQFIMCYTILLLFEDIHCRGFSQWEFSLWRIIRVRSGK